jgi:hypothetical protein
MKSQGHVLALVACAFLCLYGTASAWRYSIEHAGIDYYHDWAVTAAIRQCGQPNVYASAGRSDLNGCAEKYARGVGSTRLAKVIRHWEDPKPTGTPFGYAVLSVFVSRDYEQSFRLFQGVSLLSMIVAFGLLGRLWKLPWPLVLGAAGLSLVAFEPVSSDMRVANLNRILLLGLAAFLWIRSVARGASGAHRAWWSVVGGFVLGLLALTKPIFFPVVVCLATRRAIEQRWREEGTELLGVLAAVGVAAIATLFSFGTLDAWKWWAENASAMVPDAQITIPMGNYAPMRLLGEQFGTLGRVTALVVGTGLCLFAWMGPRRLEGRFHAAFDGEELAVGMGLLVYCWTMRMVWPHYFLLFLPWLGLFVWNGVLQRRVELLALAGLSTVAFAAGGPAWSLLAMSSLSAAFVVASRKEPKMHEIVKPVEVVTP